MRRRALFLLALALPLAGCETTSEVMDGKKVDYKSAVQMPSLEVPPELSNPSRDNRYAVPDSAKSSATLSGYQAERNQGRVNLGVLPGFDGMRVERDGSHRWLVVEKVPPEKLWPAIKDFWQEQGFLISVEAPEAGVMETDWAENRAKVAQGMIRDTLGRWLDSLYSTGERDKFRTRLERTADGQGSEVYISHRGMQEVYLRELDYQTTWQPRPIDPGLEAEFLRRVMTRLGASDDKARTLLGADGQAQKRAELRKGLDGAELLQVFEPFDRTWRRVGLALDRGGFTVEDRDRQKGLYFVRYADLDIDREKPGFFTRLFQSKDDAKAKAEQFRVLVTAEEERSQVKVLNKDGAPDQSKTAQRILTLLHDQLK